MRITAIKQQQRQSHRYSFFVDGRYSFSLSEAVFLEHRLHTGQELDARELKQLKELSGQDKLYGLALHYISLRPRSIWEMETYLSRKKATTTEAQEILNKLTALGLLDDLNFARSWIQQRRLLKSVSKRRLVQELHQKHIADDLVDEVMNEDQTDELEVLQALITRRRQQTKYQNNDKLMQYLARQGFSYGHIRDALKIVDEDT